MLAKAARQPGTSVTRDVLARDFTQANIKGLLVTVHSHSRVANGRGPKLFPEARLTRNDHAAVLRLRSSCVWTAACRHAKGRCASPACSRCGDTETLEHFLCACPGLEKERSRVTTADRRQGLPASSLEHLLFPSRPHLPALQSLVEFLDETGIAAYH